MANIVLGIFAAIFFICILTGSELLYALGAGFFLFVGYGLYKKYSLSDVLSMAWKGVMSVRTIFIVFMLIGMLTGVWRASGTIAYIITLASDFIEPSIFILIAFLLNCAVSFLLGTSFGTSATMGVITMCDRNDHRYAGRPWWEAPSLPASTSATACRRLDLCAPRQRPNGSRPLYEYKKYGKIRSSAIPHFLRDLLCSWRNASRCRRVSRSFCRL